MIRSLRVVAGGLAIAAPLVLLIDPQASFNVDWTHHLWFTGFFGEYFRQHLAVPEVLHTSAAVGLAQPVFYGFLLFPLLGLLSSVLGASLALRAACLAVALCQFWAIWSAGANTLVHRGLRFAVAISTIWSTYALTNLYNRAAVPEFLAAGFLISAISFGIAAAFTPKPAEQRFFVWIGGLCALLAVGGHPPTAVIGVPFLLVVGGLTVVRWKRDSTGTSKSTWACLVGIGCASGVVLAPWIYANLLFRDSLVIVSGFGTLSYYTDTTDSWLGRWSPIPLRPASIADGISHNETAYLESPVNVLCLAVILWNIILSVRAGNRSPKTLRDPTWQVVVGIGLMLTLFVGLITLSLSRDLGMTIPFAVARYIQFAYRLVTGCNVSLLVAALLSGWLATKSRALNTNAKSAGAIALAGILLWGFATLIKLQHATALAWRDGSPQYTLKENHGALITADKPQIPLDYAVLKNLPAWTRAEQPRDVRLPVGTVGNTFGIVGNVTIESSQNEWYRTNVTAFPWNRLLLDGQTIPPANLKRLGAVLVAHVPEGKHRLEYAWSPDPSWHRLRILSLSTLLLLGASTGIWICQRLWINLSDRGNDATGGDNAANGKGIAVNII